MLGAAAWNPLVAGAFILGPILLAGRASFDRRRAAEDGSRPAWTRSQRAAAWAIGVALIGANWAYVIWHGN